VNRCLVLDHEPRREHWALTVACGALIGFCVLGIALLVSGCAPQSPPLRYQVYLDPNALSSKDIDTVLQALASWQAVTPVYLDPQLGACPADIQSGDICVRYLPADEAGERLGRTEPGSGWGMVWLRSPVTLQAAGHELGHAQGIDFHLGAGTVMCAEQSCAAADVTPADGAAWQAVR
jgi:hypothetical protein